MFAQMWLFAHLLFLHISRLHRVLTCKKEKEKGGGSSPPSESAAGVLQGASRELTSKKKSPHLL